MHQKQQTYRNADYLAWIRAQSCAICGSGPCQASHQRLLSGGTGSKPHDYHVIPCCNDCHRLEHHRGVVTTWNERGWRNFKDKHDLRDYLRGLCERYFERYQKQPGNAPATISRDLKGWVGFNKKKALNLRKGEIMAHEYEGNMVNEFDYKPNAVGEAMAGHEFRVTGHKKADSYQNELTDFVDLVIAEAKLLASLAPSENLEEFERRVKHLADKLVI